MASETPSDETPSTPRKSAESAPKPDWADGLRQLYDSVVDEALPDSFKDLIDKLDEAGDSDADSTSDGEK